MIKQVGRAVRTTSRSKLEKARATRPTISMEGLNHD